MFLKCDSQKAELGNFFPTGWACALGSKQRGLQVNGKVLKVQHLVSSNSHRH
jgi:hypothetical protein